MKIGVGADHRGIRLKSSIRDFLEKQHYRVIDYGTESQSSADYPEIALRVAENVSKRRIKFGILSCYTGQGMTMAANKVKGVRAALCTKPEIARLARAHNDANVLVIPGVMKFNSAVRRMIEVFIHTKFEGGRHLRRINQIKRYEDSTGRI